MQVTKSARAFVVCLRTIFLQIALGTVRLIAASASLLRRYIASLLPHALLITSIVVFLSLSPNRIFSQEFCLGFLLGAIGMLHLIIWAFRRPIIRVAELALASCLAQKNNTGEGTGPATM